MFDTSWWQKIIKVVVSFVITGLIVLGLISCGDRSVAEIRNQNEAQSGSSLASRSSNVSEVSPPAVIQQLRQSLETRRPQVTILSPQPDEIFQDNTVNVRLQVQDLEIFKNKDFNLGPHLNIILDNQPYINIYNLSEPVVFSDLAPGTHTLRVFATYPWEESFKNEGAYAQTTFHIFAKDNNNSPALDKPLLTYNTPQGTFSTEPVLLDFYLTNAPLHLVAQANQQTNIADWRIRCTINGESFILDRWQPLYLQGFQPGRNWVQLEFIDEQGNSLPNVFNNTVRVVNYEPTTTDTLGRLIKGQISIAEARGIVDSNYVYEAPSVIPTPTPSPTPEVEPEPEQVPLDVDETEVQQPQQQAEPELEPAEPIVEPKPDLEKQPSGFFDRWRRRQVQPQPSIAPEEIPEQTPEELEIPAPQQTIPEVETVEPQSSEEVEPVIIPSEEAAPEASESASPTEGTQSLEKPPSRFKNRWRRRSANQPSPELPLVPEIVDSPSAELKALEPQRQEELQLEATEDLQQPEEVVIP